jgi:RND superfamily putative drug exporter
MRLTNPDAVIIGSGAGGGIAAKVLAEGGMKVLLDATIVRSVLVPATMKLLGDKNWYLPSWLRWLPRIGVEGEEETQAAE